MKYAIQEIPEQQRELFPAGEMHPRCTPEYWRALDELISTRARYAVRYDLTPHGWKHQETFDTLEQAEAFAATLED